MSDSEEYDLKKSKESIGQLYPILEAKDGEIIDGFHRQKADKNWKRIRLENIDTEEKKLIARLVSNYHRRKISREEKEQWINGLAKIYQKQGLKVEGTHNQIKNRIMQVTGLGNVTVGLYLTAEFKQEPPHIKSRPMVSASQVIEGLGESRKEGYGKQLVERFREEIKAEEKLTPKEKAEREAEKQRKKEEQNQKREENKRLKEEKLQKQAEERAKSLKAKELIKDKDFQREVLKEISKPRIVKASEPCPSGVCELPGTIDAGPPVDVGAERIAAFWKAHPKCQCKKCGHYSDCGVIRC